ncbi:MAG: hypothetical protein D4R84_10340 [Rhodocyclaceae bacterium]|nr:MAG: hypothetical protein D4R84_10340 [Rhodocyclaceae bacterium]
MGRIDILLFAEDPSAANYAALLLPAFARQGWSARLYAAAIACGWLHSRGVEFTEVATDADARSFLREVNPRCVLTGTAENPETFGLRLIDAAHVAGIPSVAFIDALMSAAYRFRGTTGDPLAHAPDRLLVPDSKTLAAFASLGYPQDHIAVCGHPQCEQTRALASQWVSEGGPPAFRRQLFPELDPSRRVIVFVSEGTPRFGQMPRREFADFGFHGRGIDKGRTKIILEEVLDVVAELSDQPYMVFRAHPTESAESYAEYGSEIDRISSSGEPLELIYAADLVVGMTSMLLLEAALLGRSTLAVLAQESEVELLPSVRSGLTPYVLNRAALRELLPVLLGGKVAWSSRGGEDLMVSGAAERVVRVLAGLVEKGREQGDRI